MLVLAAAGAAAARLSGCVGVVGFGGVAQAFWCTDALIPGIRRDGD